MQNRVQFFVLLRLILKIFIKNVTVAENIIVDKHRRKKFLFQLHKLDAIHESVFTSLPLSTSANGIAQIGISIEPLSAIDSKVPAVGITPSQQVNSFEK